MQHFDSFAQMQRDAERRVMEMQKRAMEAVQSPETSCCSPERKDDECKNIQPCAHSEEPPCKTEGQNILSKLNLSEDDSEKALLIVILLLLMRENADQRLILALLYILL